MKKNLANIITSIRLIGAVILTVFEVSSREFLIIYAICGATDCVDGLVARTLKIESDLGRKLDSVSDLLLYGVMLIKVWPVLASILPQASLMIIIGLLVTRLILYVSYGLLQHKFLSTHSILNKLTSMLMFMLPFALIFPWGNYYCHLIMVIGTLATLGEIYFIISEARQTVSNNWRI